jgi:hypothetical protein
MPLQEWKDEGLKKVLLLRRTRTRTGYFIALIAGAMCLYSEILVAPVNHQNIFNPELILALCGVLWGAYLSVVYMKGKR